MDANIRESSHIFTIIKMVSISLQTLSPTSMQCIGAIAYIIVSDMMFILDPHFSKLEDKTYLETNFILDPGLSKGVLCNHLCQWSVVRPSVVCL